MALLCFEPFTKVLSRHSAQPPQAPQPVALCAVPRPWTLPFGDVTVRNVTVSATPRVAVPGGPQRAGSVSVTESYFTVPPPPPALPAGHHGARLAVRARSRGPDGGRGTRHRTGNSQSTVKHAVKSGAPRYT